MKSLKNIIKKTSRKGNEKNMPKLSLKLIMEKVKKKRNIEHVSILPDTIRKRYKRNTNFCLKHGPESPLYSLEPTIVTMLKALSRISNSLKQNEAIQLINSLIEGTEYEHNLKTFQIKSGINSDSNLLGKVG